jgi:hypothetical protein
LAFTSNVFFGDGSWLKEQVAKSIEKLPVKVKDVVYKVCGQAPEILFHYNVFLSANMTVAPLYFGSTV